MRILIVIVLLGALSGSLAAAGYPLEVLPPSDRHMQDPVTGVELLFLTAGSDVYDRGAYFHESAWLADDSLVIFNRVEPKKELLGYLFATGEVVRLSTPAGRLSGAATAHTGSRIFAYRDHQVLELTLSVEVSPDGGKTPSQVTCTERVIATLPEQPIHYITENCTGQLLGCEYRTKDRGDGMYVVDVRSGRIVRDTGIVNFGAHMQFSRHDPNLFSFAGRPNRLMVWDIREPKPRCVHREVEGEHLTHESWWVEGQMIFLGSYRDKEQHLKVVDPRTGIVRILGAGAWVPWQGEGDDVLNRWNWWHAAGDYQGRWVAADNWWGDIAVFDGTSTQPHRLAAGHRKYGGGAEAEDPHPQWDRGGRRVIFTSQLLGGSHPCVATLPAAWPRVEPLAPDDPVVTGLTPKSQATGTGQVPPVR